MQIYVMQQLSRMQDAMALAAEVIGAWSVSYDARDAEHAARLADGRPWVAMEGNPTDAEIGRRLKAELVRMRG